MSLGGTDFVPIDSLLPTQLYVSGAKLRRYYSLYKNGGADVLQPVLVRTLPCGTVLAEDNEKLYVLARCGITNVPVCEANSVNVKELLIRSDWCHDSSILTVRDLERRICNEDYYRGVWLSMLEGLHDSINSNPAYRDEYQKLTDPEEKLNVLHDVCGDRLPNNAESFAVYAYFCDGLAVGVLCAELNDLYRVAKYRFMRIHPDFETVYARQTLLDCFINDAEMAQCRYALANIIGFDDNSPSVRFFTNTGFDIISRSILLNNKGYTYRLLLPLNFNKDRSSSLPLLPNTTGTAKAYEYMEGLQ